MEKPVQARQEHGRGQPQGKTAVQKTESVMRSEKE